jgi:hypothetical protein
MCHSTSSRVLQRFRQEFGAEMLQNNKHCSLLVHGFLEHLSEHENLEFSEDRVNLVRYSSQLN